MTTIPDKTQFTIGCICALPIESIAVATFLDEEYEGPIDWKEVHDNNDYTLGRIGPHKVVIAACPGGQDGLVPAATVARDLARTFPNIRVTLLVGIGGGGPSAKNDVRLGDVVVSRGTSTLPAVLQYDKGKQWQPVKRPTSTSEPDGTSQPFSDAFDVHSLLNQPPPILLSTCVGLESYHKRKGNGLRADVEAALQRMRKRLQKEYAEPDPSTDVLYRVSHVHKTDDDDDVSQPCCGLVEDTLQARTDRDVDEEDVAIHYGPIGSANTLMKNASRRDELSKRHGILCFEMEAAGLMNQLPCLVIRGICDYADSHKNKLWQGYAAMTAAAYTKNLLRRLAPGQVEQTRTMREVMERLEGQSQSLTRIEHKMDAASEDRHEEKWRSWLRPADPSSNFIKARSQRHGHSGNWLLQSDMFNRWQTQPGSFLWLYGMAGCGKTVLSSTILSHLSNDGKDWSKILYFYYDFADVGKQTLEATIRTLLYQLSRLSATSARAIRDAWEKHDCGSRQADPEQLYKLFHAQLAQAGETWLVLDAVDECTTRNGSAIQGLLEWLKQLHCERDNLHLLLTSRPESDIETAIKAWTQQQAMVPIQGDNVSEDIDAYIEGTITHDTRLSRWRERPDVQDKIRTELSTKAGGMFVFTPPYRISSLLADLSRFRWVSCQLDLVAECRDSRKLELVLTRLPKTLYQTYDRMLERIDVDDRELAFRLLRFLIYSPRPLSLDEAADVLIVDTHQDVGVHVEHRLPRPEEITDFCPGLVTIVTWLDYGREYQALQLAHFSVQEYFKSNQMNPDLRHAFSDETSFKCLTRVSLTYILRHDPSRGVGETRKKFPLATFCARYWTTYARRVLDTDERTQKMVMSLFKPAQLYRRWVRLYDPADAGPYERPSESTELLIFYAATTGMKWMVEKLLNLDADVTTPVFKYTASLISAVSRGFKDVAMLLLTKGANPNARLRHPWLVYEQNVLGVAVDKKNLDMLKVLLDNGANVDAKCSRHGNALQTAIRQQEIEMVELLLNSGASGYTPTGYYDHAFDAAFKYPDDGKLLLGKGADTITEKYGIGGNVLANAVFGGCAEIVKALLDNGPHVHAQGPRYDDALFIAASRGDLRIVGLLLDRDADIDACSSELHSPLTIAACCGRTEVVQLLLDRGANIDARRRDEISPLSYAARGGHLEVVKLLLDRGAKVDAYGSNESSPLGEAVLGGHREVVKILLDGGANVNALALNNLKSLYVVREGSPTDISGDDFYARWLGEYDTSMCIAASRGDIDMLLILLEAGAQADCVGNIKRNPAYVAAMSGHAGTAAFLIDRLFSAAGLYDISQMQHAAYLLDRLPETQDLNDLAYQQRDLMGRSILHFAAMNRSARVVSAYIDFCTPMNIADHFGWTPLHWAAYVDNAVAIPLLVHKGANAAERDRRGKTPMDIAVDNACQASLNALSESDPSMSPVADGALQGPKLEGNCNSCAQGFFHEQNHCVDCSRYDLCYRCYHDVAALHPGHSFVDDFRYKAVDLAWFYYGSDLSFLYDTGSGISI